MLTLGTRVPGVSGGEIPETVCLLSVKHMNGITEYRTLSHLCTVNI